MKNKKYLINCILGSVLFASISSLITYSILTRDKFSDGDCLTITVNHRFIIAQVKDSVFTGTYLLNRLNTDYSSSGISWIDKKVVNVSAKKLDCTIAEAITEVNNK